MPLRVIRGALREDPERVQALIELEDRILERALASAEDSSRVSRKAGARALRRAPQRARPPRGDRRADAQPARLRPGRREDHRGDRRASAPAATRRRSASPCTTRCATARRSSRWSQEEVRALLERLAGEVRGRARDGDRRRRRRAAARADRRDALQAAARRAAQPSRARAEACERAATDAGQAAHQRARWCSITPSAGVRSSHGRRAATPEKRPERRAVVAAHEQQVARGGCARPRRAKRSSPEPSSNARSLERSAAKCTGPPRAAWPSTHTARSLPSAGR